MQKKKHTHREPKKTTHAQHTPTKRKQAESGRKTATNRYEKIISDHIDHIKKAFRPRYQRETDTRKELQPDNTFVTVKFLKKVKDDKGEAVPPPPEIDAADVFRRIAGRDPTMAKTASIAAGIPAPDDENYKQTVRDVAAAIDVDDLETFFEALLTYGPRLLTDPYLNSVAEGWWLETLDPKVALNKGDAAVERLKRIGDTLSGVGSGGRELSPEEKLERRRASLDKYNEKQRNVTAAKQTVAKQLVRKIKRQKKYLLEMEVSKDRVEEEARRDVVADYCEANPDVKENEVIEIIKAVRSLMSSNT